MVAKGESYGTVYRFCNYTTMNHAAITNSRNVMDEVMLLHQQIGNMNEKGLKIMHEQGMLYGIKFYTLY